jgi:hypothetical protein
MVHPEDNQHPGIPPTPIPFGYPVPEPPPPEPRLPGTLRLVLALYLALFMGLALIGGDLWRMSEAPYAFFAPVALVGYLLGVLLVPVANWGLMRERAWADRLTRYYAGAMCLIGLVYFAELCLAHQRIRTHGYSTTGMMLFYQGFLTDIGPWWLGRAVMWGVVLLLYRWRQRKIASSVPA